jgi:hypothetical protein
VASRPAHRPSEEGVAVVHHALTVIGEHRLSLAPLRVF